MGIIGFCAIMISYFTVSVWAENCKARRDKREPSLSSCTKGSRRMGSVTE